MENQEKIESMKHKFKEYLVMEVNFDMLPRNLIQNWLTAHGYLDNLDNRVLLCVEYLDYYTENILPKRIMKITKVLREITI